MNNGEKPLTLWLLAHPKIGNTRVVKTFYVRGWQFYWTLRRIFLAAEIFIKEITK
jgi:hypothetical protein